MKIAPPYPVRLERNARTTMPESVSSFTNFAKLGISRQKSKLSPTFLSNRRPKIAIRKASGEVDRRPATNTPQSSSTSSMGNAKLVNATQLSAQSVRGAFAIVKAMQHEDLEIIKTKKICYEKNSAKSMRIFTFKHIGKTIKGQIFTGLLIIFTVI